MYKKPSTDMFSQQKFIYDGHLGRIDFASRSVELC